MLFQNNDIQALPNNQFQHKGLETLEKPTSVDSDLKTALELFPIKVRSTVGKTFLLLTFFSFSLLLTQVILGMQLAEESFYMQHYISLLATCTESYIVVGIQLM